MKLSRQTIDRLIALSEAQPRYGEWKEFCQREGVTYDVLRYWRRKLSLRRLKYPKRNMVTREMHPTAA